MSEPLHAGFPCAEAWLASPVHAEVIESCQKESGTAHYAEILTGGKYPHSVRENECPSDSSQQSHSLSAEAHLEQLSILIDTSTLENVVGKCNEEKFYEKALCYGHDTLYASKTPAGSYERATFPIAVKHGDEPARLETYNARIAVGQDANLPATLGLRSMQERDAVLVLREGKEFMAFPESGGYRIQWSPGTKVLPWSFSVRVICGPVRQV